MTPNDASTLDRLWDDVPVGAPPIDDLVRGGRTMRRRARLRVAGGAAALTLAVVAGSTVAANMVFDGTSPRPDGEVPAALDVPTAPAGQRLVGAGRVVIEVPADWGTNELDLCGSPEVATVWFGDVNAPNHCLENPYRGASLQFTTLDTDDGKAAVKFATQLRLVDGVDVFRELVACPDDGYCIGDTTVRLVVVPSENVALTISGPMDARKVLDAIADSVQILPEGYTTVPYVEGNSVAAWKTAIAEAGLVPDGALPECEDNVRIEDPDLVPAALCLTNPPIRPDPAPGSVVAVGTTVILFPTMTTSEDLRGQWRLTSAVLHGQAFDAPEDAHLTLVVSGAGNQADGESQAHAGCTVVWLDPQIDGSSVTLREIDRGSMRSCLLNDGDSHLDEPYLSAVTTIDHAVRSDEELTLTGPDVRLTFVKTG